VKQTFGVDVYGIQAERPVSSRCHQPIKRHFREAHLNSFSLTSPVQHLRGGCLVPKGIRNQGETVKLSAGVAQAAVKP